MQLVSGREGVEMIKTIKTLIILIVLILTINIISAETSVSQYGITWTFNGDYTVGTFANGDYWVVGPVTITSITPNFNGINHGWQVNPPGGRPQGFEAGAGNFDPGDGRVPVHDLSDSNPYTAQPGESIIKVISKFPGSSDDCYSCCLTTAAVLTVVGSVPPGNGADVFRPPYVGTDKSYYYVNDLHTELLPSLEPVPNLKTLEWVETRFQKVQLDHVGSRTGRILHPEDHMPNYGGDIGRDNADGALGLMLNDPLSEKMPALIAYVQMGIDLYHAVLNGQTWPSGGGHETGRKIAISFAAALFDHQGMKNAVINADFFEEDAVLYYSDNAGTALFGRRNEMTDERYWEYVVSESGNRAHSDPYEYIDGGKPGMGYQTVCLSQNWKSSAIAVHLMPSMRPVWTNDAFFEYVDRWVEEGVYSQPDPCAPADGVCDGGSNNGGDCTTAGDSHTAGDGGQHEHCPGGECIYDWNGYGVRYGPRNDGSCIPDTDSWDGMGRYPLRHGKEVDGGRRESEFARDMWNAYRYYTPEPCTGYCCPSDHTCSSPRSGTCSSGTCCASQSACTQAPDCGDGTCDPGETCSSCPADCPTGSGEVCCSRTIYTGDCCSPSDCSGGEVCVSHSCQQAQGNFLPEQIIEAEDGIITSTMQTGTDAGASEGEYVYTGTSHQGNVAFTFDIQQTGQYRMEARVFTSSPADGHNSFYVGLNGYDPQTPGNAENTYDTLTTDVFAWDDVSLRGPNGNYSWSEYDPMIWDLSQGTHTLTFYGKESNTWLDQIILRSVSQSACGESDGDGDGIVSISELISYIGEWKVGNVLIGELIDAIGKWKAGCS